MPNEPQKLEILTRDNLIKTIVSLGVLFLTFVYGTLIGRLEGVEKLTINNQERVSAVEGDIKEIKESVKWLEKAKENYLKANGQMNINDFLEELLTNK